MRIQSQAPENTDQSGASNARRFGEVSQFCFLRVGALGDLLVSLAALEESFQIFPNAMAWVIGPPLWLEILDPRLWPGVNGIIILEGKTKGRFYRPHWSLSPTGVRLCHGWEAVGGPTPLEDFYEACQGSINLRVESYRYAWGPFQSLVRYRFGTCPWPLRFLYTHWSPWLGKDPIIHERDRMLHILEGTDKKSLRLVSTRHNRSELKRLQTGEYGKSVDKHKVFQPHQNPATLAGKWKDRALPPISLADPSRLKDYGLISGKYWVINPTASRWEKAWPKEKFRNWVSQISPIAKSEGREIRILGSPRETEWLREVAADPTTILQPKSVGELANIIHLAELLVTNTSAAQFIAACTKTPTLTIMGRTFPARWGPLGQKDAYVEGRVPKGFSGDIFQEDYAGYDSLSVEEVLTAFLSFRKGLRP